MTVCTVAPDTNNRASKVSKQITQSVSVKSEQITNLKIQVT